jgi:peptidoglycan/LPS O-acetylase OafA/YrhL
MNVKVAQAQRTPSEGALATGPKARIRDIECLRGVAVTMVILYHLPDALLTWPMPRLAHIQDNYFQTWPGVDLFLAISGFVIGRNLLPALSVSTDKARTIFAFWIRRFWRLTPSAWTWLAVIIFCCVFFNKSGVFDTFHTNFESALAAMLNVANFREAAAFMKFSYGPSSPYWSLSLEEQFYFALPLLAYVFRRHLCPALIIITLIFFALPYQPWVMMIRAHAILLGVLLAIAYDQPIYPALTPAFLRGRSWLGSAVLVLLLGAICALAPYGQRITPYPLDFIAVLNAALVFIASYNEDFLFGQGSVRTVLTWIGTRSYAIYLVHVPAFCATQEIWHRILPKGTVFGPHNLLALLATGIPLLLFCAELNFRYLEVPLRRHGAAISARLEAIPKLVM